MTSSGATCIVPFWNEEKNIATVLSELVQVQALKQIICVNDGSTDHSSEIVKQFPQVELIEQPHNMGKSAAVKVGLDHAKYDDIVLFDADIINLSHTEIAASYELFTTKKIDMLILGRTCPNLLLRLTRGDIIISGERWLKKADLEKIYATLKFEKFGLEAAVNYYMSEHHKVIYWFQTSAENTFKTAKYGFVEGWLSTFHEIVTLFSSQFSIIDQLIRFRPKEIKAPALAEG